MTYKICSTCVMDTSDPDISFDKDGVCNHCHNAKNLLNNQWFPNKEGESKMLDASKIIKKIGADNEYDCIIGVSGGVDSSYLLHVATTMMGLRPLVVHVDGGWNSEIAVANIEKMVTKLNLDLVTYVVDWEEMRDLQLSYLKSSVANQDIPQDHTFFAKLYEIAISKNIKYVVTGSNLTSESILPDSWGYSASDGKQLHAIHKLFGEKKLKTFPSMNFWQLAIYWPYIKKMKVISPLNWIDYDKNKAIDFLQKEYSWNYYGGKHHESKWTKFFQAYYLPTKFGFDKRRAHLSSMIVSGQITREVALSELDKPLYDKEELRDDKSFVARKLGITDGELDAYMELPNKSYLDYPNIEETLALFRKIKNYVVRT